MADYGTDVSTFVPSPVDIAAGRPTGLDALFRVISGPVVVLESCARRLMTSRGSMQWDLDYGYDLTALVGGRISAVRQSRIREDIRQELLKDRRVLDASAVLTEVTAHNWTVTVKVKLAEGPIALVLNVDNVTVSILRYNAAA